MRLLEVFAISCGAILLPAAASGAVAPSPVADAVQNRDAQAVQTLIAQKADVNAPQADGTTAMHWAARWGNLTVADLLVKAGAQAAIANRDGATPLFLAALGGNAAMIEKLISAGADPNAPVLSHGETALMFAARSGHADAVVALLSLGAQVNAAESLRGTTALMWAAEHGHAAVLEVLLEHGADIQQQSRVFTPVQAAGLGWARGPGPARQLRADAQPGASPDLYRRGDMTALLYAVREGHTDCVKMILEAGAKIDGPAVDGSTPLLVAVQNGRYDIANYLLAKGANVNTPNQKGWTPLYLAVKSHDQEITSVPGPHNEGSLEFIVALLDHGADPNVRIKAETEVHQTMNSLWLKEAGATPLLRAALCGDLTVVKILLAHGADPNIPTFDNTTPLMVAAGVGWSDGMLKEHSPEETLELMKLLVDLGGDVNKANDHGITALHGAGFKGANKAVEYLVSKGANMAALDKGEDYGFGKSSVPMTPLDWATGVPIGMSSAIFHDETVKLIVRLMQERGIPVEFHTYHLAKDESYGGIGQQYPTTQ